MLIRGLILFFVFFQSCFAATKLTLTQALSETLENQWDIFISEMEICNQKGLYQSSEGPFDPIFQLSGQYMYGSTYSSQLGIYIPPGPIFIPDAGVIQSNYPQGVNVNLLTTTLSGSLQKKSRFGTQFSLQAQAQNNYNPLDILYSGYSNLTGYTSVGTSTITVTVDQPLLKGFLNSKETMNEKSLEYQVQATKSSFVNQISLQVYQTTKAYWNLIKAHKLFKAYKDSEYQNQLFVQDVEKLVEKNQIAKTQLSQPLKDYLSTKTTVAQAKQDIIEASQALAMAMGAPEKFMMFCNEQLVLDEFPKKKIYDSITCQTAIKPATMFATTHRQDLKALGFYKMALDMQVKGAFNETLPSLDFEFQGTTTNNLYKIGKFPALKSFDMPYPQKEFSFQLTLNFPLFRDYGKGQYKSAKAQKKQADLKYSKLENQIITDVIDAINNHNAIIDELTDIQEAINQANIYLDQQKKLFKAGLTDLFELLQAHNNKVEQEVRKINIETLFFQNVANIRYSLGVIVKGHPRHDKIEIDDMTTLPVDFWLNVR